MPKQKTHKATAKRIKVTGRGKVKRHRAAARHLLSAKTAKRKRHLKRATTQGGRPGKKLLKLIGRA